jgi:putative ABC transport system permease protein
MPVLPLRLLGSKQTALNSATSPSRSRYSAQKLLRSALTILGIVIGITTVITVTAVINGLNDNVLGGIRELGSDTIIAYRFPWASLSRPPSEWFTRKELQPEWADEIAKLPHIKAASASMRIFQPMFGSGTEDVRRGANRAKSVILQGNEPSIGEIFDLKIESGRFFNETDAEHRAPVVLLGYDTVRTLFPESPSNSIGQEVPIERNSHRVSLFKSSAREFPAEPRNNSAYMPFTTLQTLSVQVALFSRGL